MKKLFTYSAAMMVALSAVASDGVKVTTGQVGMKLSRISANGKYAVGDRTIWNIEDGSSVTTDLSELAFLVSVSNNGIAVGSDDNYAVMMDLSGNLTYFDGTNKNQYSDAHAISSDGTIIVGSRFDDTFSGDACYWENGTHHVLPIPSELEDVPADIEIEYSVATGVSSDGSVIVGNLVMSNGVDALVMWTRTSTGDYEYHGLYAGLEEFGFEEEKPYINITAEGVSDDGKYIALTLQKNSFVDENFYVGRYDVAKGEIECSSAIADISGDYHACSVANNGSIVGFIEQGSASMYGRKAFIWTASNEAPELLSTFCNNNEAVTALENADAMVATGISADAKYVGGFTLKEAASTPFIITLPSILDAVNTIVAEENGKVVYDLQGRRVNGEPQSGLYIIRENGKTQKVLVK